MNSDKGYAKLKVLEEAHTLVLVVYRVTNTFPKHENLSLVSQMRRSAISVAANIVEENAKNSYKDFLRFLNTSNGSLVELEYYFQLSLDLNYIKLSEYKKLENQRIIVRSLLHGFMKSLRTKLAT